MNNSSLNFDNAYVYLLIELKPESSKINKNELDKFLIDIWLAIPESPTSYQYKKLLETFQSNQSYTQAEIEEKISNLIQGKSISITLDKRIVEQSSYSRYS